MIMLPFFSSLNDRSSYMHNKSSPICHTANQVQYVTQQIKSSMSHSKSSQICHTANQVKYVTEQTKSNMSHSKSSQIRHTTNRVKYVTQQTKSNMSHNKSSQIRHTTNQVKYVTQQIKSNMSHSKSSQICHRANQVKYVTQQIKSNTSHNKSSQICHTTNQVKYVTQQTKSNTSHNKSSQICHTANQVFIQNSDGFAIIETYIDALKCCYILKGFQSSIYILHFNDIMVFIVVLFSNTFHNFDFFFQMTGHSRGTSFDSKAMSNMTCACNTIIFCRIILPSKPMERKTTVFNIWNPRFIRIVVFGVR